MTVTTTPKPAAPATATSKGRTVTKADLEALAADEATMIRDLRAKWAAGSIEFTTADEAFKAAQITMENTRVVLARVAYAAAMVHPFKGEANLLDATRILYSADYSNKAENKKVESKKNTLRPYLEAGQALALAGLESRTTAPDEDDRNVVNVAFERYNKEQAKARKAKAKAAKGEVSEESTEPEGRSTDPATDDDALTFAAILANLARANNALTVYIENGGKVTTSDVDTFNAAAATLAARLEELAV